MADNEIYGKWFFDMLDANNLTLDGFLALHDVEQANLWVNNIPKTDGFEFHSQLEWQLDNLYGDILYNEWKHAKSK